MELRSTLLSLAAAQTDEWKICLKAAQILKAKRVAPGVVLKIVPATDRIWKSCLEDGLIAIFKKQAPWFQMPAVQAVRQDRSDRTVRVKSQ